MQMVISLTQVSDCAFFTHELLFTDNKLSWREVLADGPIFRRKTRSNWK